MVDNIFMLDEQYFDDFLNYKYKYEKHNNIFKK